MDVSQIDDMQELKALAYDQMVLQEQIQHNLALITARLAELEATQQSAPANLSSRKKVTD